MAANRNLHNCRGAATLVSVSAYRPWWVRRDRWGGGVGPWTGWAGWFWVVGAAEGGGEKGGGKPSGEPRMLLFWWIHAKCKSCVRENDAGAVPSGDRGLWTLPFLLLSESQVQNGAARAASEYFRLTSTRLLNPGRIPLRTQNHHDRII